MTAKNVTEIVEFCFVPGYPDETVVELVDALEKNFHSKQRGFMDTELLKDASGKWVMVQHWECMEDLKEVIKKMMKDPATEDFRNAIDPATVKMQLLSRVQTW